MRSNIDT